MPDLFVPLDVNFQDDDKLLSVSAAAELVYIRAMALSKRLLSDGYIASSHLRRLCDKLDDPPEELAEELADRGLLAPLDGGYRIVSWMKHNKPADEIREASDHGRRGSLIRWHNEGKHDEQAYEGCPKCENATRLDGPPSSPLDSPPIGGADAHSRDRDIVETETTTPSANGKPSSSGTHQQQRFQAIADACGLDVSQLTKNERGKLNAAEKQLREIDVDPDEIAPAAQVWRRKFPDAELTPQALSNNWAQLQSSRPQDAEGTAFLV